MKETQRIPRVLKINEVDGYRVSLLFSSGESRVVNFRHLLTDVFRVKQGQPGHRLLEDPALFRSIQVSGSSVAWKGLGVEGQDAKGRIVFYAYEPDPLLLYQHSQTDESQQPALGLLIRQARLEAGLTQGELAQRSGVSKQYLSRLENLHANVTLPILQQIVEAGLGKSLHIEIR